ncbi:metallophosphoesterase family protein [Pseudaquabacterium pictum]|uniref:Calcineurin-like phosphoesterase domain-containing protein n=1 Tax=Pseudaquabacterium pictum TaxID=2315236 RepID=A0A480B186_9BURK|nr:metallophosphoesterase [Rubrivivax pictus]GCL66362.1 hypothetical protein AQPW35_54430 [Rubrivivax pictus]
MSFNTIPQDPAKSILLFGDPHSDFTPVIRAVVQHRPAAVILLGDLTPVQPLHLALGRLTELTEVWFIHGNHDGDDELAWDAITTDIVGSELEHRNLHGKVATIAGLKVAGLGGVFRESVWYPRRDAKAEAAFETPEDLRRHMKPAERWRGGISLKHRTSIFPSEVEALGTVCKSPSPMCLVPL